MSAAAQRRFAGFCLVLAVAGLQACGGGSSGPPPPPPPPPPASLVITSTVLPNAVQGSAYNFTLTASGGTGARTWSKGVNFPEWLSLDASTGALSGTPPVSGYSFGTLVDVTVQDSGSPQQRTSAALTLQLIQKLEIVPTNWSPLSNGTRGLPYAGTASSRGGWLTPSWSFAGGELPPGLSLTPHPWDSHSIQLTGTPSKEGTYTFTLQVTDTGPPPQTASQAFTVAIDTQLVITTVSLKPGVVGRTYSDTPTFINGVPPFTWSAPYLIGGLVMNTVTGDISGTPTSPGYSTPTLQVTDSSSPPQTATKMVSLNIYDVLSLPAADPFTVRIGQYSWVYLHTNNGGVPPLRWSMQSGSVPLGMTLSSAYFEVDGVPTQTGTWKFGVHIEDSAVPPQTYDQPYSIVVLPPAPVIKNGGNLPDAVLGQAYSAAVVGGQGTPPYTWTEAGTLPAGLTLDSSSGRISGTPTASGSFNFRATLTDAASPAQSANAWFYLKVKDKPLRRNDTIATATNIGNNYAQASLSPYADPPDTANPDTDFYRLVAVGGSTVSVSVNATRADPVIEIVDAGGTRLRTCNDPADDNPTLTYIARDPTPGAFDDECRNDDIDPTVNTNAALTFQPPGTSSDAVTFYLHVMEARGIARPDFNYDLSVSGVLWPVTIGSSLPTAAVGKPYSANVGSGGTWPLTVSLLSGSLPPGLALIAPSTISGTATQAGTWSFDLQARDSGTPQLTSTATVTLRVVEPLRVATAALPDATTGVPYDVGLQLTGGTGAPLNWMTTFYSTPWLSLDTATYRISGVPTQPGSFSVSVSVSDELGGEYKTWGLVVKPGPLFVATTALDNPNLGWIYSALLKAAGGAPPFAWALAAGTLPPGLTLNSTTGELRGIPTTTGTYAFTVQVSDGQAPPATATANYALNVNAAP